MSQGSDRGRGAPSTLHPTDGSADAPESLGVAREETFGLGS